MNPLLTPLAAGFRVGVALRYAAYRRGWFKTQRLGRPVLSVGNLTVGGTGKTPFVASIAGLLLKRGWKPSILTRGYGRRRGAGIIVSEPRSGRVVDPREVGDEPALLVRALPEVPVVIGADRYRAGLVAERRFGVDVHILDDGFQHVSLARDVDIVLVDVTQNPSEDALLPAGRLREPYSAIERADLVVLTRVDLGEPDSIQDRVRRFHPRAAIFRASTQLCGLVDLASGREYPAGAFRGKSVCALCGIGNPQAFFADLRRWGFSVIFEKSFPDHHVYRDVELELLFSVTADLGAAAWVTTEKDGVNMPRFNKATLPMLACVIQTEVREGEAFEEVLLERLEARRRGAA